MSNHTNHRRNEESRTENGPRRESPNPGAGCNSTHVARARRAWKAIKNRTFRRTGRVSPKYFGHAIPVAPIKDGEVA